MGESEVFCLRWDNHNTNLRSVFCNLLTEEQFCDITLAAEGQSIQAHKLVLIACSDYFKALLTPLRDGQHPLIVLNGISFSELRALLDYMYYGEVSISKSDLPNLIRSSKSLKIKSLGEVSDELESFEPKDLRDIQGSVSKSDETEVSDDGSINTCDGKTQILQDSFVSDDNIEEEMDEEEEILYLDQNNKIITSCDQPHHNQTIETVETVISDKDEIVKHSPKQDAHSILHTKNNKNQVVHKQAVKQDELIKESIVQKAQEFIISKTKSTSKPELNKIEVEMDLDEPLSPSKIFSASGPQYRKRQSKVWTFFEKSSDGAHVICNACGEVQRFMSNTTNMIRHIVKVHSNKEKMKFSEPIRQVKQLRRKVCQRSPVWNYFHRIANLPKVQCKLCLENYSYSGNTTNLRFHMRTRHANVYEKINEEAKKEGEVSEKEYENIEYSLKKGNKKVNIEMVLNKSSALKAETISVEVCNLESGDRLGGPVYVATAPSSGYLL